MTVARLVLLLYKQRILAIDILGVSIKKISRFRFKELSLGFFFF